MKVALGQFAVAPEWQDNLESCRALITRARSEHADLLVLPEGILARNVSDPGILERTAQPLEGPFITELLPHTHGLTVAGCVMVPNADGRLFNTLVVLQDGVLTTAYNKLHLYDAFDKRESDKITPGQDLPPIIRVRDMKVGLMTCYDIRFPEVARHLAFSGADVLAIPAAWLRGPNKERHWEILNVARALENTCYVVAVGECGPSNIGASMVVDPLGIITTALGESPGLGFATLERSRIEHARSVLPVLNNCRFTPPTLK